MVTWRIEIIGRKKRLYWKLGALLFVGVMLGAAFWELLEWTKRNEVENTTTPLSFFILTHMSSPSRLTSSWDYPDSLVQGHEKRKLSPSWGPFLTVSHPSTNLAQRCLTWVIRGGRQSRWQRNGKERRGRRGGKEEEKKNQIEKEHKAGR